MARWSIAAALDLEAIWEHQTYWNGEDRADHICDWLLDLAEQIDPSRCPHAPIPGARKYVKNGYVFLVRELRNEVQIIGVFGPGMNSTTRAAPR